MIYVATLLAVFVFSAVFPSVARGSDKGPEPVYLQAGEPAPYDGDLLSPERSIELVVKAEGCALRMDAALHHAQTLAGIELGAERDAAAVVLAAERARADALRAELGRVDAWYRSPLFVAGLTAALMLAFGGTLAYIWSQVAP